MYLDSAIIVKLVVREPDSLFYAEQVDMRDGVCSSALAMTEVWSALSRKTQEGSIDTKTKHHAWRLFEDHISGGALHLHAVTTPILRMANRMIELCGKRVAVKSLDAIHLATCEFYGTMPLMTNDKIMRSAAKILGLALGPLMPAGRDQV